MTLTPKRGGFETRLRFGGGRRERFLIAIDPAGGETAHEAATKIEERMQAMATLLARVGSKRTRELLDEAASVAGDERKFRALERVVDQHAAELDREAAAQAKKAPALTFRRLAEDWCSGKLHRDYPEDVPFKKQKGAKATLGFLSVFFPVLGQLPIAQIGDAEIVEAKRRIPADLDPDSRRLYLSRLRSVFKLAVEPLGLIEHVPKEARKVPRKKKRGLFWFLYPDEEAKLIACTKIPLAWRVLYAWLSRNGGRVGETSLLDHAHLDLEQGEVTIEAEWTKTGRARYWKLEPDVLVAMKAWRSLDGDPAPEARVFHTTRTRTFTSQGMLHRLLKDLKRAGVDRRALHVTTAGSRKLRGHDFRTGFCTMARRRGMPDDWIMARSGHENAGQLEQYVKSARHVEELGLPAWYAPMDQTIPELRAEAERLGLYDTPALTAPALTAPALGSDDAPGSKVGQGWAKTPRPGRKQASRETSAYSMTESPADPKEQETAQKPPSRTPAIPGSAPPGPAEIQGVGQVGPGSPQAESAREDTADSPVEKALAGALTAAIAAQEWELAKSIVAELGERRRARVAPGVPSLADVRAKKKGDKP